MSSIEKAINKLGNKDGLKREPSGMPEINPIAAEDDENSRTAGRSKSIRTIEINFSKLSEMGFLTPEDNASSIAQELRIIKRPILTNATHKAGRNKAKNNLLVVTSAVPGEGKTFSAINLAISIALEVDQRVLLVDADNARAGISDALSFDAGLGLSDLLSDSTLSIDDVLIHTNMPNLTLISAGAQKPNMTELFASDAMRRVLTDMSNRYPDRIVIFDSSPITVTTEARVLASLVNQILLVVEANGTPQQVVKTAIENLGKDKEIGIMLNKTLSNNVTGYGYGYGSRN
jgi:exopolysaccharide/PEP-CTERM locus tyrosine autokinase